MDEFQKQMIEFMTEAKMRQKEEEERRRADETRMAEERRNVAERLNGLVEEIQQSVKDGIKKEIQEAVEPLKSRQDKIEKETDDTNAKINKMAEEMSEIKVQLSKMTEKTPDSWADKLSKGGAAKNDLPAGWKARNVTCQEVDNKEEAIKKVFRETRKIIGMKPIDKAHVEQTMRRNKEEDEGLDKDQRWKKAMNQTVKQFLKYEMKMKQEDMDSLEIVKIFPPAKDNWNTLYVELDSLDMVNFVMSFTQYMRGGDQRENRPSIEKYIPKELFNRYSAIEKVAFEIRQHSNFKIATNVSFWESDFVLKQRSKDIQPGGSRTPWRHLDPLDLPGDLPQFELYPMRSSSRTLRSPSQAPGRPPVTPEQREKRKDRGTPGSPMIPTSKLLKTATTLASHPAGRIPPLPSHRAGSSPTLPSHPAGSSPPLPAALPCQQSSPASSTTLPTDPPCLQSSNNKEDSKSRA